MYNTGLINKRLFYITIIFYYIIIYYILFYYDVIFLYVEYNIFLIYIKLVTQKKKKEIDQHST